MKSFNKDLFYILNKIKNREYFSFSKYADGEYAILRNQFITNCDGWTFDPQKHALEKKLLLESFEYSHENYHIGIVCPCCCSLESVNWMRAKAKTKNITWANLFVNNNYYDFKNNFFPEFNNWEGRVVLIGNENGVGKKLPFKCNIFYPIPIGAWINPTLTKIINRFKKLAKEENNQLFLFSAGPLGNILAHQLHLINPNNIYLDIGSTINPWLTNNNRGYLNGLDQKTCIW